MLDNIRERRAYSKRKRGGKEARYQIVRLSLFKVVPTTMRELRQQQPIQISNQVFPVAQR